MPGVDWEAARADYIAGMPMQAVADKYHTKKTRVAEHAKRGQWTAARTARAEGAGTGTAVRSTDDIDEMTADEAIRSAAADLARIAAVTARREYDHGAIVLQDAEAAARIAARAQQMILDAARMELEKQRAGLDSGGVHIVIQLPDGCGD